MLSGPNCCVNPSIISTFLDHEPQSTATKNMIHLSQSNCSYFPNSNIMYDNIIYGKTMVLNCGCDYAANIYIGKMQKNVVVMLLQKPQNSLYCSCRLQFKTMDKTTLEVL